MTLVIKSMTIVPFCDSLKWFNKDKGKQLRAIHMKINIKKQDTNQLYKDLMVIALVVNALALVTTLVVLNSFTVQRSTVNPMYHKTILSLSFSQLCTLAEDTKENKKPTTGKAQASIFRIVFPSGETIFLVSFAIPRHGFILENKADSLEKETPHSKVRTPSFAVGSRYVLSSRLISEKLADSIVAVTCYALNAN